MKEGSLDFNKLIEKIRNVDKNDMIIYIRFILILNFKINIKFCINKYN